MGCRLFRSAIQAEKSNPNQMIMFIVIFIIANLSFFPFVSGQILAPGPQPGGASGSLTTAVPGGTSNSLTTTLPGGTNTLRTTQPSGNGIDSSRQDINTFYLCSEAFAPLDETQTLVFDKPVPEAAGYCKNHASIDNLACALRTCSGFSTCSGCSRVTSQPDDPKITTDGIVIPKPQQCELAYYSTSKPGQASLCLTANLDVFQCTNGCQQATSCGTCFKVTETPQQSQGAGS